MTSPRTDAWRCDTVRATRRAAAGMARVRGILHVMALCGALIPGAVAAAAAPGSRWLSLSALAGSAQPIAAMADYQWDVRPHVAWGAQFLAGMGPFAAGLRWWQGGTTQSVNLAGVADPAVRTGSVELVARARVARWRRLQLQAMASGGRLSIRYRPDRLVIDAGGTPLDVTLQPLHEWVAGAGAALELPLNDRWAVAFETERRLYALDTAHRSGSTVTFARETFGDWDARCALSRGWNW
jgi:hypothetical protein